MNNDRLFKTAAVLVSLSAGCFLIWAVSEHLVGILLPFFIAYIASAVMRPVASWLSSRTRLNRKICGGAVTLIVFFAVVYLLIHLSGRLADEMSAFVSELGTIGGDIRRFLRDLREKLPFSSDFFESSAYETVIAAFQEAAVSFGGKLTAFLTSVCTALPGSVFSVIVCAAAFYYLTSDPEGVAESFRSLLPEKFTESAGKLISRISGAMFGYIRAYLVIMTITFFELLVGLSILNVPYVFVISLIVTIVDALPVLGAGSVLGPWALIAFIRGDAALGTGMLVLLAVMYVVRQFLEPRFIGRFIGVHPFIALAAVFAGYRLCGVFGMIAAPVLLYTAKAATDTGENDTSWRNNAEKNEKKRP